MITTDHRVCGKRREIIYDSCHRIWSIYTVKKKDKCFLRYTTTVSPKIPKSVALSLESSRKKKFRNFKKNL